MKKVIAAILMIAVLAMAGAFAEETTQNGQATGGSQQGGFPGGPMAGGPQQGGFPGGQMMGGPQQGGFPGGQMMGGMPQGGPGMAMSNASGLIDFDSMVANGVISQETCDKIDAYIEQNLSGAMPAMNGEAPSDLPEMNGEAPSDLPEMNGETPSDLPETNGEVPQTDGQAPQIDGQAPQRDGQAPQMNGQMPQMNGQMPQMGGQGLTAESLLSTLLNAQVITQEEYDALSAALDSSANATTGAVEA